MPSRKFDIADCQRQIAEQFVRGEKIAAFGKQPAQFILRNLVFTGSNHLLNFFQIFLARPCDSAIRAAPRNRHHHERQSVFCFRRCAAFYRRARRLRGFDQTRSQKARWNVFERAIKSRRCSVNQRFMRVQLPQHFYQDPLMATATANIDQQASSAWRSTLRRRLLRWYRRNARDLAWRRTSDPYAIWVSEIMLQQTQVATVQRYFPRFLAAFPTITELAAAHEDRVLRLWEGLGYYRRARQLHAAAKKIVAEHAGHFPRNIEAVRSLPGIGRYSAGAILSIAFDAPLPILEANTIRLFARLIAYRKDVASPAAQKLLWETAGSLLPRQGSGTFNQALMELGSLVCTPRNPKCCQCPLQSLCPTYAEGLQERIPAAQRPPNMEDVREIAVIVRNSKGAVLLRKCGKAERWAGLWDFPRFSNPNGSTVSKDIKSQVDKLTGIGITNLKRLTELRHGVTRFRITLSCFTARCSETPRLKSVEGEIRWVSPDELDSYPLSTTGRKLAGLLLPSTGRIDRSLQ